MSAIRAILFDADGVIQHPTDDLAGRLQDALGLVPEPLARFLQDVFDAEWRAATGKRDFVETLVPVVEKWGATGRAESFANCWAAIEVDPAVMALVSRLRQTGYVCALATNQQSHRATHMADVLGYRQAFDHSFYSWELGFMKPDLRYFHALLAVLPFAAGEMLFIDDRRANVAAAQSLGLKTAHFIHDRGKNAALDLERLLARFGVHASA